MVRWATAGSCWRSATTTRLRFWYQPWVYKALTFTVAGMMAGLGGALYFQKDHHAQGEEPFWSILVVAWVAFAARHAGGQARGVGGESGHNVMTSEAFQYGWRPRRVVHPRAAARRADEYPG